MREKPSIQQLENFIIYGKVHNFATAARLANITQSAFSFQMKKLEEIVGVQLITRSTRGSHLTREGEFFLSKAIKIVDDLNNAMDELQKFSGKTVSLNIGALMSLGDVLMNRHVSYFKRHNKNININVYNLEAKILLRKLENGEIDIASSFLLPQMSLDGYVKEFFYQDELVYYAPNLNLSDKEFSSAIIEQIPFASYSPDYFMATAIDDYFKQININPNIEARLSTPYAIMQYCKSNKTGAFLSKRILSEMGQLTGYYPLEKPLCFNAYLIYKHENPKISSIKIFVDYILNLYNTIKE